MYLCEVAIVSQLCISFPYVLHGLCEDYLTCDIAFNAVMPPSRASTRGRYSRIEGVAGTHLVKAYVALSFWSRTCTYILVDVEARMCCSRGAHVACTHTSSDQGARK